MTTGHSGFDIEAFLNSLAQRLFPVWYANQAVKEMPLADMGVLNPNSFLCHRWLSLHSVIQAMQGSLENAGSEWQTLHQLLGKLIVEQDYQRPLSLSAIQGVEYSGHDANLPNIASYAEHYLNDFPWESAEDFDRNVKAAFPDNEKPFRMVYREWDGRYYWVNKQEPEHFAAAALHAQQKQRDATISAHINVESLNMTTLDTLRSQFWLLLMTRDDAYRVLELLNQTPFNVILCEFEWRRSDLVVLCAEKNQTKLNTIMLNLQNNRSSQQITDLGRYLNRHHHPFRNQ